MPTTVMPEIEKTSYETLKDGLLKADVPAVSEEDDSGHYTDPIKENENRIRETANGSFSQKSNFDQPDDFNAILRKPANAGKHGKPRPYGMIQPYGRDSIPDLWKDEDDEEYDSELPVRSMERSTA